MQNARKGQRQPIIGIGCDIAGGPPPSSQLRIEYSDAVLLAGGVPVLLPAYRSEEEAGAALASIDGLLLTGGNDYHPAAYGADPHPTHAGLHPLRQEGDLLLARRALQSRIPILGICGGLQLLNIVLGGDLIQDIPSEVRDPSVHRGDPAGPPAPGHPVRILPGTLLSRIVRREELLVNTSHHQAARRLGTGLRPAALAPDGVVEAIESLALPAASPPEGGGPGAGAETGAAEARFLLAVQWHPERDPGEPHRALFTALVEAALRARGGRRT
jgi:putative glutamine amidotransferase